jgi:hypothetical protein
VGYLFDWDKDKSRINIKKHGISFEEASTVFGDPLSLLMNDPDHSIEEERYILLGMSLNNRLLVVSFSERLPFTRIISVRRATRTERGKYEENK